MRWSALAVAIGYATVAYAQTPTPAAAPADTPAPQAVALPDIAGTAQADLARIASLQASLTSHKDLDEIDQGSRKLTPEIEARLKDSARILSARASVDVLRSLQ